MDSILVDIDYCCNLYIVTVATGNVVTVAIVVTFVVTILATVVATIRDIGNCCNLLQVVDEVKFWLIRVALLPG